MISGASEEDLKIASIRADIMVALKEKYGNYGLLNKLDKYQENEFLKKADKITYETSQDMLSELKQENEKLKRHLIVPENVTLKTLEDYKNYYTNTTKEDILNDTYMDYCAYLNTIHILTEFEKWLNEKINYWEQQEKEWVKLGFIKIGGEANNKLIFKKCLDELQELKGNTNAKI